jgi:hypothetical protein
MLSVWKRFDAQVQIFAKQGKGGKTVKGEK